MRTVPGPLDTLIARCPDPAAVDHALGRLPPERRDRIVDDPELGRAAVVVMAASRSLTRVITVDPEAIEVLAHLDDRPPPPPPGDGAEVLARWKQREHLRIAARDLLAIDALPAVGAALAALATDVLAIACRIADSGSGLAVIGMGKLGGRELNYASDVDVMFVGEANPLPVMEIVRRCFRVDTNLRPEGRSGRLVIPLAAYEAYWDRWAQPWEFQALLKARPVAGDPALGAAFASAAATRVWQRPFGVDDLRALREMKARAEKAVARRGLSEREVKRGRGGIRDAEFAVQLLQLVHGRADPALRSPNTLEALSELGSAGYVDPSDATVLAAGYTFLRTVEHRLQLDDDQQVHAVPEDPVARARLARVMGYRDDAGASALARFDGDLGRHQRAVRLLHEQLYFRPLLHAFTEGAPPAMGATAAAGAHAATGGAPETGAPVTGAPVTGAPVTGAPAMGAPAMGRQAISERLAAFGFADLERTRSMLATLTRGLTRSSRLMEQMLPLILDWLSRSPDPDLGLVGLSHLAGRSAPGLVATFRDSPEAARRLCVLLGTSRLFHRDLDQQPEMLAALANDAALRPRGGAELGAAARSALDWRSDTDARRAGLVRLKRAESLRVAAADVLGLADAAEVGAGLTALAEACLAAALETVDGTVGLAVVGLGRLGGAELSYASDLDIVVVSAAQAPAEEVAANGAVEALLALVHGSTPAHRLYSLDLGLRPEGRSGALSRTAGGYRSYYEQWAQTWERQALLRARLVAGDPELGARFMAVIEPWVWRPPSAEEVREIRRMKARIERERIPPREDPQFHLKLGKGSLSDVEWTVQLLQLTHQVRGQNTMAVLGALEEAEALSRPDARALAESYRFCERTRNRLALINAPRTAGANSLPTDTDQLARLARSLGTTGPLLRDRYRQVTRRARAVMERLFYGKGE